MTCEHCVASVRETLEAAPGVHHAAVSLANGTAHVVADESVTTSTLQRLFEGGDYQVAEFTADPPAPVVPTPVASADAKAGSPAPRTVRLERTASVAVAVGAPLLVEPGVWRAGKESVVVLPSLQEARLERVPPPGAAADLPAALPRAAGADLGPWLLLLTLLLAFIEWRVAAWAGRRYGA